MLNLPLPYKLTLLCHPAAQDYTSAANTRPGTTDSVLSIPDESPSKVRCQTLKRSGNHNIPKFQAACQVCIHTLDDATHN